MGGTAVMRGDIELMGVPPVPDTRENPANLIRKNWCGSHTQNVVSYIQGLTTVLQLHYECSLILHAFQVFG